MPLTQRVTFKAMLQKKNLIQVPKLIRWKYKLEPTETMKITVNLVESMGLRENFIGNMHKDGRILIPKIQRALLRGGEPSIEGYIFEVTLEPT